MMKKFTALNITLVLFIAGCGSSVTNPDAPQQASNAKVTVPSGTAENIPTAKSDSGESFYQGQFQQSLMAGNTANGNVYLTHPSLSSVTNETLPRQTTLGSLEGTYVKVLNDEGPEAGSSTNSFVYSPSDPHFDEVNLYFHIDRFRYNFIRELANRRGDHLSFTQITAHAHAQRAGADTVAWYDPITKEIYFGDASSNSSINDLAKEDKTIYHEYSHAVLNAIHHEFDVKNNDEEAAIYEGIPDYFAGSFTDRSVSGDYVFSNPNASDKTRDMANPEISSYGEYQNIKNSEGEVEAHKGGEFFSSILWDLHEDWAINPSNIDFLVYDALYRLDAEPTFLEFREAMISADSAEFNNQHKELIQNTFAAAGIGSPAPPLEVNLYGSMALNSDQIGSWTVMVDNSDGPVTYKWYYQTVLMDPSTWFNAHDYDDYYSTSFHNSEPTDLTAAVKVIVTSGGETVRKIKQVTINGCDSDPPILPKGGDVSINKKDAPLCPPQ